MAALQETQGQVGPHGPGGASVNFFLYVEGPSDADILRIWGRRISRRLARHLESRIVILGGRRPARARDHFRAECRAGCSGRGLVVLDRDHHTRAEDFSSLEPGLEIFTWQRRHIESYLLVAPAIRRALRRAIEPHLLDRLIEECVPALEDEAACREANAKKILGSKGQLARSAGGRLSPAGVARCMRVEEFHPDIFALYERIRRVTGLEDQPPVTGIRHEAAGSA